MTTTKDWKYKRPVTSWDDVPIVMDLPFAARIVGVSLDRLKKRCQMGEFPAYKEGTLWRVEKQKLRDYMDERDVTRNRA